MKKKVSLGFFPTALHALPALSAQYEDYQLFIKRDDLTGLATGGNKTRKLEFLIQEAVSRGCDTIITAGAQQSNHCRQTAAACAITKLECHLLVGGERPASFDGNLLLSELLGARIHFSGNNRKGEDIPGLAQQLSREGKRPYVIPYGGSNLTGARGLVEAARELKEQLNAMKLRIDYIFFATSSGGSQAGLILGKHLHGLDAHLVGINIDKNETHGQDLSDVIRSIVEEGREHFGIERLIDPSDISLVKGYDQAGYGTVTEQEKNAIRILARQEGILLDPVYTGRAFHGMLDHLNKGLVPKNSNVLFWHTGGLPANFYYRNELVDG